MQNVGRLTDEQRDLVALLFTQACGWTLTYMVEVRLDDPIRHMLCGGDGLVVHGGGGSKHYAKHVDDPGWAIVHAADVPEWNISEMAEKATARLEEYEIAYPDEK